MKIFIKRKLLIYLLLCAFILLIIPFASGCSNGGFKAVYKVEYTTNGQTKSQSSTRHFDSSESVITKEEYDSAPSNKKNTTFRLSEYHKIPNKAKGKTVYTEKLIKTDTDDLIRYSERFHSIGQVYIYFKMELRSVTYYYIYVKVVNSTTIIIRSHKGETTYTVSSYSITNFK